MTMQVGAGDHVTTRLRLPRTVMLPCPRRVPTPGEHYLDFEYFNLLDFATEYPNWHIVDAVAFSQSQ